MCGVAGVIDPVRRRAESMVAAMEAQMHARGPDDGGTWSAPTGAGRWLALGSRRLAVIDTTTGGHQPMIDESTGVAIVYNGMTYNYRLLQSDLRARGANFASGADTEVVLRLYLERGLDAFAELDGMFGLGIWDPRNDTLVLARDRFGIKPLYFAETDDGFLFGSQVRAILASGAVPFMPSAVGLANYLATGAAVDPHTIVEGIEALHAGSMLVVQGDRVERRTFWKPGWPVVDIPWRRAIAEFRDRVGASVRSHLISDVPTGVFLSGGLDSSVIAALAAKDSPQIRSISVTFAERSYSEAPFSRIAAAHFGTQHCEVRLGASDLVAMLPGVFSAMDQPTFDGVNTYVVSKAAHDAGLKVALSGLGADELLDGYDLRRRVSMLNAAGRLPGHVRRAGLALVGATAFGHERKLQAWMSQPGSGAAAYALLRGLFLADEIRRLMPRCYDEPQPAEPSAAVALTKTNDLAWLDMSGYMRNVLLRDSDAMSMANSLELRVPYLDNAVVDLVMSLPQNVRSRRKRLMAEAFRDLVPVEILERPKRGFVLPIGPWMRSLLEEDVDARLRDVPARLRPLLDAEAVMLFWHAFRQDGRHWLRPWSLYALFGWWSSVDAEMKTCR